MKTLIERLDEYIEYAEKTKRFADVGFYKEIQEELKTSYEGLALVDKLCYSTSDEEEKKIAKELIDWQRKQDDDAIYQMIVGQERLGGDFQKVLNDNTWDLYEKSPPNEG